MKIEVKKTNKTPNVVNAVCVDVVELGMQPTPWGDKPKIKVVFETDHVNDYGERVILTRTYTASLYEKSSLYKDLVTWGIYDPRAACNEIDSSCLRDESAKLTLKAKVTEDGGVFHQIVKVEPANTKIIPSGKYTRR